MKTSFLTKSSDGNKGWLFQVAWADRCQDGGVQMFKDIDLISVTLISSSWSLETGKYDLMLELLVYLQSFSF